MSTTPGTFKNITDWHASMLDKAVQSNFTVNGADFLSSETVALCAGPASFDGANLTKDLIPIGLVQNAQVQQQKQIQQLFEIGSRKPFFIPGRTVISAAISRILFDGPSLMYAMYIMGNEGGANGKLSQPLPSIKTDNDAPTLPFNVGETTIAGFSDSSSDDNKSNSPGQFFINLASSFFNKPMGLGFILYDGEKNPYGGFYLEDVYIQTHAFSVASQQTLLVENVSLRCSSMRPLDINSFI